MEREKKHTHNLTICVIPFQKHRVDLISIERDHKYFIIVFLWIGQQIVKRAWWKQCLDATRRRSGLKIEWLPSHRALNEHVNQHIAAKLHDETILKYRPVYYYFKYKTNC